MTLPIEADRNSQPHDPVSRQLVDLSIVQALAVLWRRKLVILATLVLVVVLGVTVNGQFTRLYTAAATVMVEPRQQQVIQIESVISDLPASMESLRSEVLVLRSRALAREVIAQLGLAGVEELNPVQSGSPSVSARAKAWLKSSLRGALEAIGLLAPKSPSDAATAAHLAEIAAERKSAQLINRFLSRLEVSIVGGSRVIRIGFTSEDPRLSRDVANAVAEAYVSGHVRLKRDAVARANSFLGDRLGELRYEAEGAERAVEAFRAGTPVVSDLDRDLVAEQIYRLKQAHIEAKLEQDQAGQRVGMAERGLRARGPDAVFLAAQSPVGEQLRMEVLRLRQEESELRAKVGPKHPDMLALMAQIEKQEGQMAAEAARVLADLRDSRDSAAAKVAAIEAELLTLQSSADEINVASVALRTLEREAVASGEVFQSFLDRYKETEQMGFEKPDARILSFADIPTGPSFPNSKVTYAAAAVLGGCLGAILVLLLELGVRGFRSAEEVEARFGLPVAAVVPSLGRGPGWWPVGRRARGRARALGRYLARNPNSAFAEAHKGAFASLAIAQRQDQLANTVMVTSSLPNEGKTMFLLGLATSLAKTGVRVLVLDCDLRASELRRGNGVADYVLGGQSLSDVVMEDVRTGAFVVPPGRELDDPLRVLRSPRMARLIRDASSEFDLVLIDTPPVLAVSDATLLAEHAAQSLLVVAAVRTPRDVVQQAVTRLRRCGTHLYGIVLTKVRVGRGGIYSPSTIAYSDKGFRKYYQS